MSPLPLLPVTTVGSWPRPPELLRAQRLKQTGRLSPEAFERQADAAVQEVLRLQDEAGMDIVTGGEQRRDNFYSFVAEKLAGVQLMTLLRTEAVESVDTIRAAIAQALQLYPAERVFLNPDCGFGTFSNRPVNSSEIAFKKLQAIVEAARLTGC